MKSHIKSATVLILVILLLAACAQPVQQPTATHPPQPPTKPTEPQTTTNGQLDGARWILGSYLDESGSLKVVVPGSQITAKFSAGQIGGRAGCNSYFGDYQAQGSSLTFGPLGSTMMACEEPLMQQESAFLAALGKTVSFQITENQISLLDAQGAVILIFSVDSPAASIPASPDVQSKLTGITWKWVETIQPSGKQVAPADPAQYTLQFNPDGGLKIQADCNLGTGDYTLDGNLLTIHVGILTLAMCADGSLSGEFLQYLNKAGSFFFQDGALYIEEIYDGGTLKFIP